MLDTRHVIKVLTATNRIPARLRDGLSRREKCRIFSPTDSSSSFTVSALTEKTKHDLIQRIKCMDFHRSLRVPSSLHTDVLGRILTVTQGCPSMSTADSLSAGSTTNISLISSYREKKMIIKIKEHF